MAKTMSHLLFALLLSTLCLVMCRAEPQARSSLRLGVKQSSPPQLATGKSTSAVETTPKIQWVDCAEHVPAPIVENNITLPSSLPSTLHCGLLVVPMDYSKKLSSSNNITLGFAMYRPKNPQGLLIYNPGGGNSEVASTAWGIALNVTSPETTWTSPDLFDGLKTFDILAVDLRGASQSNPLNCPSGTVTLPSYIPSNEQEYNVYRTIMKTYAQSCIDNSTPKGIVAHLSAEYTSQDWNRIRQALGYEKLNYLGVSFGTIEGTQYAHDFPEHTGRFVIDAVAARGVSNLEQVTDQTKAVNRLLLRADAFCLNNATCPFHSEGKGSILKAFSEVLSQAAAGNTSNTTVSPSDIRARVTLSYLSGNVDFVGLISAFYAALNDGDWSGLEWTEYAAAYVVQVLPVMPTYCSNQQIDENTWAGFDALVKSAAKFDTAHIEYGQLFTIMALCGAWPYPGESSVPLPINEAVLLVTSDFDYDAPTESTTFEFKQAHKSTLVVRHGDDHVTFFQGPGAGPVYDVEIEFLKTGVFPKATQEESMTIYPPGTTRGPIPDPYSVPTGPAAGDTGGPQPSR